jgi:NADPH:quinone reductase-like Zn-dependent oxidoreductase
MRAVTWNELGAQPALRDDLPEPTPGAGEVLVRVHASSVNPVDNGIAAGMVKDMVPHEFPVTLGRDFAGVVEQVGAEVTAVSAEDEQYLHGLGVADVLPRDGDVVAAVRERHPDGVDAIVDLVNHAPGSYDAALKDGGRVSSATGAAGERPGRTNVVATPSPEVLGRIARHLADGTLRVPIQHTYDLADAPDALQALGATHTRGKLALRVAVAEARQ